MNKRNNCILFIEYKGELITNTNDQTLDIRDLFVIAKNKDIANINQLIHIIKAHVHYGCTYTDDVMMKIKPLLSHYF